ncbi:MAG: hypothetical protein M3075_20270 [Candidatus Dormibacteraeota bacterium]|jgi:hypothetical protein|nr:hypothetical protein [Candidatus Dormibacteraeota bacterium]
MREFETEADTRLLEAETALFEAQGSDDRERPREVAAAFRRAADAVDRIGGGSLAYDADELRRLAIRWEKGYPDDPAYEADVATLKDIATRVVEAGRPPELGSSNELGAPEAG